MAYEAGNLVLLSQGNGFGHYRYDTADAATLVDAAGYFNNGDDTLNLAVGDKIDIVVWSGDIRASTISDYEEVVVNEVTAAGVVDTTNVLHGVTIADNR